MSPSVGNGDTPYPHPRLTAWGVGPSGFTGENTARAGVARGWGSGVGTVPCEAPRDASELRPAQDFCGPPRMPGGTGQQLL